MARHETAFNTDDPVLIAVGNLYREFVIDSHDEAWLLCELAKAIPIPGNTQVIATSPTVEGYSPRLGVIERNETTVITQKSPGKSPVDTLSMLVSWNATGDPDPLTVAAAFGEPTYSDADLGWEGVVFDPDSFGVDDGRSMEDLS